MRVVVRRAGAVQMLDVIDAIRPSGGGETTINEYVVIGKRVCNRYAFNAILPLTGPFTCKPDPAQATAIAGTVSPIKLVSLQSGIVGANTPAPGKIISGPHCTGFAFSTRTKSMRATGTLYVKPANGLPCEQDTTTVGQTIGIGPVSGLPAATVHWVASWSRFNDPHVVMPTLPASS